MNILEKNVNGPKLRKFITDYFFLLLLLVGIAVNYYFEMKVNRSIKTLTANQENILQIQQHSGQINQLNKKLGLLENKVRNYIISGDNEMLASFSEDVKQLNRESVLIAENLRKVAPPEALSEFKKAVQQKISFENSLVNEYRENGNAAAVTFLHSNRAINVQARLELSSSILNSKVNNEILAMNRALQKEKLDIISLDYAIPHLTSFIFLVIAGFTVFKILQVYRLNENLSRAVEKEHEAQLIKDQFMDNMTHELRSPLNAILGYTGLLMKTKMKDNQEKFVKAIRTSGELLLNVINEVLDYSKIKSGYIHFSNEPFSLREQINALSDIISDKLTEKGLEYEFDLDESVPDNLRGDGSKLLQVLLNITFNAIKFTPSGKIVLKAVCDKKSEEKVKIRFSISDTGIGIPPEKLPHIFDRFYQVQDNTTTKYAGTGLGLSITQQMITLQGGSINVESVVGQGTTFIFDMSFIIEKDFVFTGKDNLPEQFNEEGVKKPVLTKKKFLPPEMKILIVDDNALNRDMVCFILKDMGVSFRPVGSGPEAIELLKKENFDVILMDLQMPGMDGKETTKRIRTDLQLTVPVIALTAFSQASEKQKCLDAGMDAYLSKPVREKELFETLEIFSPVGGVTEKLINMNYLKGIAHDNEEFIESVILKVADTLPGEIAMLRKAVEEKDQVKVNTISHDMKTTFAVLGLSGTISEPIAYLESWKASKNSNVRAMKMLQVIEVAGAEVTFQILENFSNQNGKDQVTDFPEEKKMIS